MTAESGGIDIHGHGVPRPFLDWAAGSRPGGTAVDVSDGEYVVTFPGGAPLRPVTERMADFDARLRWMDEQGLGQQLVAPWLDVAGQDLPAPAGQEWVRRLNDCMAEAVAASGGRLRAHITLHLADPAAAAAELHRAATGLGMTGCMIPTDFPGGDLADPSYDAVFEAAESLQIPLVLHPPSVGPSMCIAGMQRFGGLYGRLIDTTMIATRLLLGGLFERHPGLQLVLVHGGGFLPYQTGRLERHAGRGRDATATALTEYVRRCHFDTVLMSSAAIRLLVELAGAEHVMVGSDYPFVGADDPGVLEHLQECALPPDAMRAIVAGNAGRLFRSQEVGAWPSPPR